MAAKIVFTHTHHIELRTRSRQRYSEDFWKLPPKQDYVITPIMALQIFENEMGVLKSLSNVSYFTFTYLVDRKEVIYHGAELRLFHCFTVLIFDA